jgi:hypothetical protein
LLPPLEAKRMPRPPLRPSAKFINFFKDTGGIEASQAAMVSKAIAAYRQLGQHWDGIRVGDHRCAADLWRAC